MVAGTKMTMAEFVQLVEDHPDKHFKFDAEGAVIEVTPKRIHRLLQIRLGHFFFTYLESGALPGYEVMSEVAHELNGWPCRPDVSIDASGDEQIITVPPLVAVEIKSDSNSYADLRNKARRYLDAGTQMVLLLFPELHQIEVHRPDQEARILNADDTLEEEDVLPEFKLAVTTLYD